MQLGEALGLAPREIVALVGAGGKTAALYRLARELLAQGRQVIATTTTHMVPPAEEGWPVVITEDVAARLDAAARALAMHGRVFVAASTTPEGKLRGIRPREVPPLAALADVTLVEADGARGRWLKAPAGHEPAIPGQATLVVPVVGLQAVGQPLSEAVVHRPQRLAHLVGLPPGGTITPGVLARLLQHPQGGLRGVPRGARVVPLCNQADSPARRAAGRLLASEILRGGGRVRRLVVGAAQSCEADCERWEPAAVVVLAAGGARRYGRLKQAEEWQGQPFLTRVAAAAHASLAREVVVVLGCQAERLLPLLAWLEGPRLRCVVNPGWEEGQASSVRAGLRAVQETAEAVVFCNADQPLLSAAAFDALLACWAATGTRVVASGYGGRLGSPALFARPLFPELAALTGDAGGRAVIARHRSEATSVDVGDLLSYADVDTPADYLRLKRIGDGECHQT